ncbi:MAG: plasma-membrane proton-efflux P-type ATPase [Bacteroidales bacterium]|nr:plasma-membrane proton-efflux P-type ATPase [Bacteroidales bacterium]
MMEQLSIDDAKKMSEEELFRKLNTSSEGLSSEEAGKRLAQVGPNALPDKHKSIILIFLGYFWGPIPWMIEIAAILSLVVKHWTDFFVIFTLLLFNAGIGFWQEMKASNALDALKAQLALKAKVLRDATWQEIDARDIVPGEIVRIKIGDIIPADMKLIDGDYVSVDQAALTGESLPVNKKAGDIAYSGTIVKQGQMTGVVSATGANTYFGKTAGLVSKAGATSHFQKAVIHIGDYLIYLSLGLVAILFIVQLSRGDNLLLLIQFALILTVASIPVAMPAVLSVTMAVGALALSKEKVIVSRLEAIEEAAGMDILCSDKTGTLTQNKLTLGTSVLFQAKDEQELILDGALSSETDTHDAIDTTVVAGIKDKKALSAYTLKKYIPFDPVRKRTEAILTDTNGKEFSVTKGATQVIMDLCKLSDDDQKRANEEVEKFASEGYKTLGVARKETGGDWKLSGILTLSDPPREDSASTIAQAAEQGIQVKMVTGDNVSIAREISGQLGLGTQIQKVDDIFRSDDDIKHPGKQIAKKIEVADGFAEVFPEHKYGIVKALQSEDHITGMTGDGVNDAPALKQADIGIAVSGATDAARAAADLILTMPGLSVIINAVAEARKIFERMNSYAMYRIIETIRIMFFVVLAMIFYNFYPITALMIILLAFFNDIPIMTIAYDNTFLSKKPVKWDMKKVMSISTVLGLIGVLETFGILIIARDYLKMGTAQIQTFIFLKLAVAGHLTLFVTRTKKPFLKSPHPAPSLLWSAVFTKVLATLFVVYPLGLITPISWTDVAFIWAYCIFWIFVEDQAKLAMYRHLEHRGGKKHDLFFSIIKNPIHPYHKH